MNSKAHKKFSFYKIIACILGICLLLAAGVLYLKLQEPGKRSADFARLQQEAYQGIGSLTLLFLVFYYKAFI